MSQASPPSSGKLGGSHILLLRTATGDNFYASKACLSPALGCGMQGQNKANRMSKSETLTTKSQGTTLG